MIVPEKFKYSSEKYVLLLIVFATLVIFAQTAGHDFINYDDNVYVYENPNLASGLTWNYIVRSFTSVYEVNWIPLTWISHGLDVQLFGLNPAGHHIINVLLHTASTGILYVILRKLTADVWKSAMVAALFAIHPLHVESVAWVAERKDVLSGFWGMLTLYYYVRYCEMPSWLRYVAVLGCYILGLLSKPMLITMPALLLIMDYWPLNRLASVRKDHTYTFGIVRILLEKVPFLLLAICSSTITYLVQKSEGELTQGYTILSRVGKACIAYITYLCKMVWPVKLAVLYPFSLYPPSTTRVTTAALFLVTVTVVVFIVRDRAPYLLAGWAWYIITLLPVIGLIQIGQHSVADRYTYIPLIGIFIMLVWGGCKIFEVAAFSPYVVRGVATALLLILAMVTNRQLKYWKDGYSIFSHTVEVTDNNWVALHNLGLINFNQGQVDKAIILFKESIRAKPSYTLPYIGLGVAYMSRHEYPEAIEAFNWVLKFDSQNQEANYSLGCMYLEQGNRVSALEAYQVLKKINSDYAPKLSDKLNIQ